MKSNFSIFATTGKGKPIKIEANIRQWRIQGRGPGGPGSPLSLDQNEARRAKKNLFGDRPPLMNGPPPYLKVWKTQEKVACLLPKLKLKTL